VNPITYYYINGELQNNIEIIQLTLQQILNLLLHFLNIKKFNITLSNQSIKIINIMVKNLLITHDFQIVIEIITTYKKIMILIFNHEPSIKQEIINNYINTSQYIKNIFGDKLDMPHNLFNL